APAAADHQVAAEQEGPLEPWLERRGPALELGPGGRVEVRREVVGEADEAGEVDLIWLIGGDHLLGDDAAQRLEAGGRRAALAAGGRPGRGGGAGRGAARAAHVGGDDTQPRAKGRSGLRRGRAAAGAPSPGSWRCASAWRWSS